MNKWINVKDQLPTESQVLIYCPERDTMYLASLISRRTYDDPEQLAWDISNDDFDDVLCLKSLRDYPYWMAVEPPANT